MKGSSASPAELSGEKRHLAAPGALEYLIRHAKRRYITNLAVDRFAWAASAMLTGLLFLLVLGTQVLDWYWPAILAAIPFGLGVWRIRKAWPSDYSLAQRIDRHLGLQDHLSTALYFLAHPPVHMQAAEFQRRKAEIMASEADPGRAIPFVFPRSAVWCAGLLVIAGSLLGVRYGLLRSLDLRAPIADFSSISFLAPAVQDAAVRKSVIQEQLEQQLKKMAISLDKENTLASDKRDATDPTQTMTVTPDGKNAVSTNEQGQTAEGKAPQEPGEGTESPDAGPSKPGDSGTEQGDQPASADAQQPGMPGKPKASQSEKGKSGGEGSSLAEKMRDAMANLLSKLKSPEKAGEDQQQMASGKQQASAQGSRPQPNPKGVKGQGKPQSENQSENQSQGPQDGESDDKGQVSKTPATDKGAEKKSSQDAKSGIGKQDGSKDVHLAEQLDAMGRISELLGKRSAQITGEMTVEVPGGKQQLKTAYSQHKAVHADAGGEANRDEVPLVYQSYVTRYFEEIRKAPAKKN